MALYLGQLQAPAEGFGEAKKRAWYADFARSGQLPLLTLSINPKNLKKSIFKSEKIKNTT